MTKAEVINFINKNSSQAGKILAEPSLVRRVRSMSNDASRIAFLKSLEAKPEPPPAQPKEEPPKKIPRRTIRSPRKKALDNN